MPRRGESIYKRKDGRWEARYIHHYEDGKAKYRFLYASTYAEVKAKRNEERHLPENIPSSHTKTCASFGEIAALWLAEVKFSVKESTYTRYYRTVKRYLNPNFGETQVRKIDVNMLNGFEQNLLETLSPKSVSDILCVLKSIFKYGRLNGYPCAPLDALKQPKKASAGAKIIPSETLKIIEEKLFYSEELASLGIIFTLYTGVRIGELCGLRWNDIDFTAQTATVRRTVERIADLSGGKSKTKVIISEPKTESSARIIPLPSFLLRRLEKHRKSGECYILTGREKPTEPHQYYLRYKTFMRGLGLEGYTFHALRHTFATRCVELGFDTKSLSEILGHANVSTTLAVYVHPTLEQKRAQMERLTPICRM